MAAAHQAELARLTGAGPNPNQGKSGIDQIKNPIARVPLQILSAVGSGLFPGIAMGIPGTQLHHNMLVHGAQNAVQSDEEIGNAQTKQELERAQTRHANAQAESLETPTGKTATNEMERFFQQNPQATVADWRKFQVDNPEKTTKEGGTVHEDAEGNYWVIHPDGSATAVTAKGQQIKAKTQEEKGGTVHEDADGNMWIVKPDGTATPVTPKTAPGATGESPGEAPTQLKGKKPGPATPEQQFVDEYLKDPKHKGANVADAQRAYEKNKQLPPLADRGQNFVDPKTHRLIRVEPGGAVPEGAVTAGGLSSETVNENKQEATAKKAREDAQKEYKLAQSLASNPSPTNDVALVMRYIGATKPDSIGKLRLNQNEINLVYGTRSTLGDLEALAQKVSSGQSLTPQQRKDMLATMRILAGDGPEETQSAVPKPGETFNGHKVLKVEKIQ